MIAYDSDDCLAHVAYLTSIVKQYISVDDDVVTNQNLETFRMATRSLSEPDRSKVFHLLNFISFNTQIDTVYGEENA
jgi:hypothetical protein